jgi:hypothetical protein
MDGKQILGGMRKAIVSSPLKVPKHLQPGFNVVIAYEDFETGKHAKRIYDFLVEQLNDECVFNNEMWKFDVLAVAKLRDMAAKDAAAADVIIVSVHGTSELPGDVKSWVEIGLTERTQAIALVALFESPERPAAASTRNFLADAARRAGIAFFAQPDSSPSLPVDIELSDRSKVNRTAKAFSVLTGVISEETSPRFWGINE